jgi:hypothetical protein
MRILNEHHNEGQTAIVTDRLWEIFHRKQALIHVTVGVAQHYTVTFIQTGVFYGNVAGVQGICGQGQRR